MRAKGPGDIKDLNVNSENWAIIKAALTAGLYPNVAFQPNPDQVKTEFKHDRQNKSADFLFAFQARSLRKIE